MEKSSAIRVGKKKRDKRPLAVISLIVIVIIAIAGLSLTGNLTGMDQTTTISIGEFAQKESIQGILEEIYQPDRQSYGMGKFYDRDSGRMLQFEIAGIFEKLPPVPSDFWRVKYLMVTGQSDVGVLKGLEGQYYKQPEFIRDTFVESGLNFWKAPDIYHWFPEGYGTYPHIELVETYPGAEFDAYTFTHTSYGVETYQGLMLVPVFLSEVNLEEGTAKIKNPEMQSSYFDVSMEPDVILLEPTYPVFEDGWIKKVKVHVKVSEGTPPGTYAIGYDVASVPSEVASQWKTQYRELYMDKSGFGITESQFQILIKVF